MDQIPFGTDDFAENPEPRCPCVLLLDNSMSMDGEPVRQLNSGLQVYQEELLSDDLAAKRVEIAVVTFGGKVATVCDFTTAANFTPPSLTVSGNTPMGSAINHAIDMVEDRKQVYKANGIHYYRPWLFLITDGAPTDEWRAAASRVKDGEASKAFSFFAVGVRSADFARLAQISVRQPLHLEGLKFRELFMWLSHSQQSVSRSTPGDEVPLTDPTSGPTGWATV